MKNMKLVALAIAASISTVANASEEQASERTLEIRETVAAYCGITLTEDSMAPIAKPGVTVDEIGELKTFNETTGNGGFKIHSNYRNPVELAWDVTLGGEAIEGLDQSQVKFVVASLSNSSLDKLSIADSITYDLESNNNMTIHSFIDFSSIDETDLYAGEVSHETTLTLTCN